MSAPELDHIAVAAWRIEEALPAYERLGFKVGPIQDVASEGVRAAFLELGGGRGHIELLEPLGERSPIQAFLEKRGPGLHHLAFKTRGIAQKMDELKKGGAQFLSELPKKGSRGTQVCFMHPKSGAGVLLELVEHTAS